MGFTIPRPAMSGAVPCTGSNRPRPVRGIDVGGRGDAHAADELGGQVGEDVAEQVARDDDVELGWVLDQLHRRSVDKKVPGLDLRMFSDSGMPTLLPKAAGVCHGVGLVDHDDLFSRDLKRVLDDAGNARKRVEVLLDGDLGLGALLEAASQADVEALGVLADNQQVHRPPVLAAQR